MTASSPRGPVSSLIGAGFGSLLVHCAARRLSLESREITILRTDDGPVATYQQYAQNLGQTVLRSGFESHLLAPDRPTFGQLDAYSHKSPKLLCRTHFELVGRVPRSGRPDAVLSPKPGAARMG